MTRVSIVVRSYNEERHIGRLCEEIAKQEVDFRYEVIVVDSGSEDATRAIAAAHGARIIRIDPEVFTFGFALNRGIAEAQGEIAVFISAHCYPSTAHWLKELVAPFEDPRVALVYGRQRGAPTSKFSERRVFAKWFPPISDFRQQLPFCNNANAAIRKSLWHDMPYDETLTGLEDVAWAKGAIDGGQLVAYNAKAVVVHVHDESWRQVFRRYRREAMAFTRIFPDERFRLAECLSLVVLNVGFDYAAAVRQQVFLRNLFAIPAFRVCQFWGTYLGYREPRSVTPELRRRFYYPARDAGVEAADAIARQSVGVE
jgi:glycosyltransferase involved in cell wall biosynthesis